MENATINKEELHEEESQELNVVCEGDLPGEYVSLVNEIGLENTLKVAKLFGGFRVYFHTFKTVEAPLRNRKIRQEFNGYNARQLAKKYTLTENQIKNICKDILEEKKLQPMKNQVSIFD